MLNKLKELFSDTASSNNAEKEDKLQLAAAVLMVEVSKSDDSVDQIELDQIKQILSEKFSLNQETIELVIEQAKQESEHAISLYEFTREICDRYDHPERVTILKSLWQVAFADGRIDKHERHFIRKIAGLLYLTDQDITLARSQAQT